MSEKVTTQTEQPAADVPTPQQDSMIGFFGIGLALNLVLVAAYGVWAYRQWKQSARRED
ncbi:MAG: hypothetical protein OEN02_19915 [Gammaproteobacteria bacterium]|nr:hypothetical protein [Gammaproteobacteria bacterium]MDH3536747.1 hypothetical protein [Gammaproteobacteria bacterium]